MARSLLRQLEQIRQSATFTDAVVNFNDSSVAEPTVSGSLEEDANVIRSLLKQLKFDSTGPTKYWYDQNDNYFDPTNTTSGSVSNKETTLSNMSGNTLDAHTIIIAVSNDAAAVGHDVTTSSSGVLLTIATRYATPDNRTGLPIYASSANPDTYFDIGGSDNVCRVDIVDMDTDGEIVDGNGDIIYGKLHDAADYPGGTGTGTDVSVIFYAADALITMVSGVSNIGVVYPQRKVLSDMEEYEWLRTDFISSWEGDIEIIADISNLWSYTGASNDATDPTWDDTAANFILQSDPADLTTAINLLNTEVGDRTYTAENYIDSGDPITESLDELDIALQVLSDSIDSGVAEKWVESVETLVVKNIEHSLPVGAPNYTPVSTASREGMNMDVYVDGQLLAADTGSYGSGADRDYGETTASGITFRFDVQVGRNITYMIRQ